MSKKPKYTDPVRRFLESYKWLRLDTVQLDRRVEMLEAQCTKITASINGVPHSGNNDSQQLWALLADERARYTEAQTEVHRKLQEIEDFIRQLDPSYRALLSLKYVDCLEWRDIHKQLCNSRTGVYFSEATMYRIYGDALKAAQQLYDTIHEKETTDGDRP